MKENRYATKYALLYTSIISIVLLTPLFLYLFYMKSIYTIQNELLLKEKSLLIIKAMQEYNNNEEYFHYPRFKSFESGLYDENFETIFSLIQTKLKYTKEGYYMDEKNSYLIVTLPLKKYFNAKYLVITHTISFASVYEKMILILLSIVGLVFILSLYFLKSFEKPLREINKQLDNFIKDSVHEINTPLSIINVNIDLYNRKNEPNKYMQRMKAASKVLSNIYQDMDYLIKYDRLEYEKVDVHLSFFLQERIEYFSEVALMKNIQIKSEIEEGVSIVMNEKQLQRVIDNNISNAIKYSYDNSDIEIKLYTQESKVKLLFKDYGVGIEDIEKVFQRYHREDTSKGGFGIGLNIVKSIIDSSEIELKINSNLKKGSEFLYTFERNNYKI